MGGVDGRGGGVPSMGKSSNSSSSSRAAGWGSFGGGAVVVAVGFVSARVDILGVGWGGVGNMGGFGGARSWESAVRWIYLLGMIEWWWWGGDQMGKYVDWEAWDTCALLS